MSNFSLEGKTVIVTGGAGGLAASFIAERLEQAEKASLVGAAGSGAPKKEAWVATGPPPSFD